LSRPDNLAVLSGSGRAMSQTHPETSVHFCLIHLRTDMGDIRDVVCGTSLIITNGTSFQKLEIFRHWEVSIRSVQLRRCHPTDQGNMP